MPNENRNNLRVLVVDDEPQVRSLVRAILSRQQCEVTEAKDGAQAYDVVRGQAGDFDVIITDVVMPRMDGLTLGRKLRAAFPNLLVLYTSADRGLSEGIPPLRWLKKPFTPQGLCAWLWANALAQTA